MKRLSPAISTRLATLFLALLLFAISGRAFAGVIDTIEVSDLTDPPQLRINFSVPLQYINHAPESRGDEVQIQLKNISTGLFSQETTLDSQQTVSAEPRPGVPFLDARYEQTSNDRGVLTIRFSRKVSYSVSPGADRRHIIVTLPRDATDQPAREPGGELPTPDAGSEQAPPAPVGPDILDRHHVINLESSIQPIAIPSLDTLEQREPLLVYTTKFPIDGRIWNRLRLGFFATRDEAQRVLEAVKKDYPRAWLSVASSEEINDALEQGGMLAARRRPLPEPALPRQVIPDIEPTRAKIPDERIEALMEQARQAVAAEEYTRAVQLYTKILQYPDHPFRQDALEFLGVARERKGQVAHAIREYERYLSLYPDGEGAQRVQQRLAGLTTARETPRKLSPRASRKDTATPWDVYGGISQFYRRDASSTDATGTIINQSSLSTDLDVTARKRSDSYDIQSRFTGSYLYDFLDSGAGDESSVSSLYIDAHHKGYGMSMRLGRQSRNTGGVLGRFDGLLLGYQLTDWLTINGVAGYPVLSTRDQVDTDKTLYGVSADLGTFANAWDFNVFIIEQQVDNIVDRRAVGGEVRYFDPTKSLLSFVDYDISYDSLNTLIFLGTWTLPDRTTLNATIDYRNSPILTTTNALQGQTVRTIDNLLDSLSEDEIRALAEDRTAENTTVTLGASHPFSERIQLSGDVTVSNLSGTDGSGGVEPIPGTGNEYFYNLQLIGNSLIKTGDIGIVGLRYSDTSTSSIYSFSLNTRYPVNRVWRINPRVRVDYRENDRDKSTQWIGSPSLRMDYRWRKRYRFEVEGGGEWSTRELTDDNEDSSSYFFSLGYRADF